MAKETKTLTLAKIYEPLLKKKRIKALFGGRGGGRSHNVARYLLGRSLNEKIRIWCAREIQNSIADSVQHLFVELIEEYGLQQYFKITDQDIISATGSYFMFKGFRGSGGTYSAERLKAYEDFDVLWVEEASACSMESLNVVSKTIRKEGSELIFTFNRVLEEDPVWRFTCYDCGDIYNTGYFEDDDRIIIYANVEKNEFATSILYKEQEQDKKRLTVDEYNRIWLGYPDRSGGMKAFFTRDMIYNNTIKPPEEETQCWEVICGFDPNGGGKDSACAVARQGREIIAIEVFRGIKDPVDLAAQFITFKRKYGAKKAYCDRGYGQGVIVMARQEGETIIPVDFGGRAVTNDNCINRRAEIYYKLKQWLQEGGYLGDPKENEIVELKRELQAVEYNLRKSDDGKIALGPKDDIRKKLGHSPDCVAEGTKILTPFGERNIEDLCIGEYVQTPLGYAKIVAIHKHLANTVEWRNGLRTTLDHKFYTQEGFKCLRDLKLGDSIYLWKKTFSLNLMLKKLYLMAKYSVLTLAEDILQPSTLSVSQDICYTDTFGKKITERFLNGIKFIIKTLIPETIRLRILNYLQLKNTCLFIQRETLKTKILRNVIWNNLKALDKKQLSGIKVKLVCNGIENMQSDLVLDTSNTINNVSCAENNLHPEKKTGVSAAIHAKKKHTLETTGKLLNAKFVAKSTTCINIQKPDIVQKNVHRRLDVVYNITLDRHNCYFANGILVSNCADALALTFAGHKDVLVRDKRGLSLEGAEDFAQEGDYYVQKFDNLDTTGLI